MRKYQLILVSKIGPCNVKGSVAISLAPCYFEWCGLWAIPNAYIIHHGYGIQQGSVLGPMCVSGQLQLGEEIQLTTNINSM